MRPEDMPDHVKQNIQEYRSSMLKILEDHMTDHNQQYLIELDANQAITVLEKVSIYATAHFFHHWFTSDLGVRVYIAR